MARIDHTRGLSIFEKKCIESFANFVRILEGRIDADCVRNGIAPEDCTISTDLSAVIGSIEYFIQEHVNNGEDTR